MTRTFYKINYNSICMKYARTYIFNLLNLVKIEVHTNAEMNDSQVLHIFLFHTLTVFKVPLM